MQFLIPRESLGNVVRKRQERSEVPTAERDDRRRVVLESRLLAVAGQADWDDRDLPAQRFYDELAGHDMVRRFREAICYLMA